MDQTHSFFAVIGAALIAVAALAAQAPEDVSEELRILKQLGLATDGNALLDYLRKQTIAEADSQQLDALIRQLGDDDFKAREAAHAKLITLGKSALVGLKRVDKDADHEIRLRAEDVRKKIEANVEPATQIARLRLIARLKPAGSADVLLAFLPFAADASVTDEVCKTLGAVANVDNGVVPILVKALEDKHPIKRGAAGEALARAKATEYLPDVRKLLKDPDPAVRVRTAAALVNARDSSAISEALPTLIDCLKHLPPDDLWAAEDILIRLAGEEKAPSASLGTAENARVQCFREWEMWYVKYQKNIDLAKLNLSEPILGNTLIVYRTINNRVLALGAVRVKQSLGEIVEVDTYKKVLWKISIDDSIATDAMVVPGQIGEVVVAEYNKQRITIRDTKTSKIVWEHSVGGFPIGVQALSDGKFLVTMQNRIALVDRATKEEKTIVNQASGVICRAKMTKGGHLVYITNAGSLTRMDAKGAVVKQFQVPVIATLYGNIDVLPNGNVLIPDSREQRVVEYDTSGNQVSQFTAPQLPPNCAMRLPKGNTLVSSFVVPRVTEFNRAGHVVWTYEAEGQIYNTRRR